MRTTLYGIQTALLSLLLASSCGDGTGGNDDVIGEDASLQEFCLANPGAECDDDDPCTLGTGICISGECLFDRTTDCSEPPDSCSANPTCDDAGACIWQIADGWCRIEGVCRQAGQSSPNNDCLQCVPGESRASWTPVSDVDCTPANNPCTTNGICDEGFCVPDAVGVECASDPDCATADDGDLCNGVWICQDCECAFDPESVITCDTGEDTACEKTTCAPQTGQCVTVVQPDGTTCDDGDPCTTGDTCFAGECKAGGDAPPVWVPLPGPKGAWLDAVVRLPGNLSPMLAVGRGGGVFRSLDLGASWTLGDLLGWGEERGDWLTVGHGATTPVLVIYGGTLFRSMDGGIQWTEAMTSCEAVVECAGVPGTFVAACQGKTWISQDGGATWPQSGGNLPGAGDREVVALAASDSLTWYLGTRNEDTAGRGKVYRTTDGGGSWTTASLPTLPDPAAVAPHGLLADPSSPTRVFAGLAHPDGAAFQFGDTVLYRSQDSGETWEALNPNTLGATIVPLTLDSVGRLLLSVDTGLNRGGNYGSGPWAFVPPPTVDSPVQLHLITQAMIDPASEFSFFVPAANGLAHAKDLGQTWEILGDGLRAGRFNVLLAASTGTLLAADPDSGRVLRSQDDGATWTAAALSLTGDATVLAALGEAADGRLFGVTTEGGLVKSDSDGEDWIHLDPDNNPLFTGIRAVAAPTPSGDSPGRVLAFMDGVGLWLNDNGALPGVEEAWTLSGFQGSSAATDLVPLLDSSTILLMSTPGESDTGTARIWRTTNAGDSWSQVASATGDAIRLFPHPGNGSFAFAGVLGDTPELLRTTNSGASWSAMPKQPTFANIRGDGGLLADPAVSGGLYAALWLSGVWRYDPIAETWALLDGSPKTAIALAEDPAAPGLLLAADGADATLWASDDQGATWTVEQDFGADFVRVRKVVTRPGVVAALLDGPAPGEGALYLRTDGSWSPVTDLPGGAWDLEAWADPDSGQTRLLAAGEGGGLYRSEDLGASWQIVESYPDTASYDIEVLDDGAAIIATAECGLEPIDGEIFDQTTPCGLLRSKDGETWEQALTLERSCAAVVLHPTLSGQAWAACPGAGLYYSSDAGQSWQNVSATISPLSNLPLAFSDVAIFDGRLALGSAVTGVYMTQPGSTTNWVNDPKNRPAPILEAVRIDADAANGNRILVSAVPGGLYLTEDDGTHWHDVGGALAPVAGWGDRLPINGAFIHADAADPAFDNGTHLWAAVEGRGLWTATPGLWAWTKIASGLPIMDSSHPYTLVESEGGVLDNLRIWLLAKEDIFRTTNGGATWQSVGAGLPPGPLLAFAPPAGPNMFASISGRQLFRAAGDGAAWTKAETIRAHGAPWPLWANRKVGFWSWIAADDTLGARITVSLDPTGLWRTEDGGLTWDPSDRGLPPGGTYAILRDKDAPGSFYVGTEDGPYLTNDGEEFSPFGENWQPDWGPPVVLFQDPDMTDRLFAITEDSTMHGIPQYDNEEPFYPIRVLLRSEDSAETWFLAGEGLPPDSGPLQILADPTVEGAYYIATATAGVLRSVDGGVSWEPWNSGLPGPRTGAYGRLRGHPMTISPAGDALYLGTSGFGLYERVFASTCSN